MKRFSAAAIVAAFLVGGVIGAIAVSLAGGPASAPSPAKDEIAGLKAEVAAMRGFLPEQSHVMMDVEYHFANLWFAAQAGHWDLAEFYLEETGSHLRWAVRTVPARRLSTGQMLDLAPMLETIQDSGLAILGDTIKARDPELFEVAYRQTMAECHACHEASEKPYLRPHIPDEAAAKVISMEPAAR